MNNPRCSKLLFAASSIFCHDDVDDNGGDNDIYKLHICISILFLYFISHLSDNDIVFFIKFRAVDALRVCVSLRSVSPHLYILSQSLSDVICTEAASSFSHTRKAILLLFSILPQSFQHNVQVCTEFIFLCCLRYMLCSLDYVQVTVDLGLVN